MFEKLNSDFYCNNFLMIEIARKLRQRYFGLNFQLHTHESRCLSCDVLLRISSLSLQPPELTCQPKHCFRGSKNNRSSTFYSLLDVCELPVSGKAEKNQVQLIFRRAGKSSWYLSNKRSDLLVVSKKTVFKFILLESTILFLVRSICKACNH